MFVIQVKRAIKILANPDVEFKKLSTRTFEDILSDYLWLLLGVAMLAASASFIFFLGKAFYLEKFALIDVDYVRMLNYSVGRSTSLAFLYVFIGTFGLFFLSLLLRIFVKIKYTTMLSIIFYSMSPILLFGWIPIANFALGIWSLFLFIIGVRIKSQKSSQRIHDSGSIQQRE
jgi:hypothetical protein